MDVKKNIIVLREIIEEHNYNYYVLDNPKISDYEFDKLLEKLISLEKKYPEYYDENSPSQKVGGEINPEFKTVNHVRKMLSLSNTYSSMELIEFDKKFIGPSTFENFLSLKDWIEKKLVNENNVDLILQMDIEGDEYEVINSLNDKILKKSDVTPKYISWLNDYEVTQFTEQKYLKHNYESVLNFVIEKYKSEQDFLFGIFYKNSHIGNMKLGPIKWEHKSAEISFFIGEKDFWGKGIATKCIKKLELCK